LKKQDTVVSCFFYNNSFKLKNTNMGRGDIKTKKGKTFAGSFGKTRPAKPAAAKKAAVKKVEAEKKA
jgi:30S ribosomal protein S31